MTQNINQWLDLTERYFDGETTDEEERRLRHFLASAEASDARFDGIKAVMGFLVVGKRMRQKRLSVAKRQWEGWATITQVAACVAFVLLVGRPFFTSAPTDCMMLSKGQRITNETVVMTEVETTMSDVFNHASAPNVEGQLHEIFHRP